MIGLKYWIAIGGVVALVAAGNLALSQAYDHGQADQQARQARVDSLLTDLRNAEKEQIENAAQKRIAAAGADRDRAVSAAAGLRGELTEIKRIARNASGAFATGGTARDAVVVLADMLDQCGERYRRVAGFADAAHNAGLTCQAQYKSIKGKLNNANH